jgi:hypothetical protein
MPSTYRRANRIISQVSRVVGISREEVIAIAQADAEHLLFALESV